jgi:two-component system, chemotaxis family, chemotaxis protein CheY
MSEMVKTAEKILDNILIIDDDKIYQLLCKQIIRNAHVTRHVESCLSAEEGLDLLKRGKNLPELIFLDINMPGMNGWDFLEAFKKLDAHIRNKVKIVMLSSSVFAADKIKAGTYREVADYVVKPLTIQRTQEIVRKYF